jgi:hypothetical protein
MEILFARFNGISLGMPRSCFFALFSSSSGFCCFVGFASNASYTFFRIFSRFFSSISPLAVNHVSIVTGNFSQKIFRSVFVTGFFFKGVGVGTCVFRRLSFLPGGAGGGGGIALALFFGTGGAGGARGGAGGGGGGGRGAPFDATLETAAGGGGGGGGGGAGVEGRIDFCCWDDIDGTFGGGEKDGGGGGGGESMSIVTSKKKFFGKSADMFAPLSPVPQWSISFR